MGKEKQWCANKACADFAKINAQNIKLHSYVERRYYCATCKQTFSFDKGTFFETLRTDRKILLDAVAMLVERNSLRAISRIKHCKADSALHWLDLAGQQAATVSHHFIRILHVPQAQIDELWTFIKKQWHLQSGDSPEAGDAWIRRAFELPSRLRVVSHLSRDRSEEEASAFLAAFKARTDGRPPLFTSDKLPTYVQTLIANYSSAEPLPTKRGSGHPRKASRRVLDAELCYAQVDKHRVGGRVVEVRRRIIFGAPEVITEILGEQQSTPPTSSVTISPRARVMGDWCARLCHTQRSAIICNVISIWKMPCSISCVHTSH